MKGKSKYAHIIKSSKQRAFRAATVPMPKGPIRSRENSWPLMVLESGQITRVRRDNIEKLKHG